MKPSLAKVPFHEPLVGWRERAVLRSMKEKLERARNPLKRDRYWKRLRAAEAKLLALKLANS